MTSEPDSGAHDQTPGTWHDRAPHKPVARDVAVEAWYLAAIRELKDVASTYGETITYGELKERLFDATGYRTRQPVHYWITPLLGSIQRRTHGSSLPPLTSLVVSSTTGEVGAGYITHGHLGEFSDAHERELAAAQDRLDCYRQFADDVPADAKPQLTRRYQARRDREQRTTRKSAAPAAKICPSCGMAMPATGRCDDCD